MRWLRFAGLDVKQLLREPMLAFTAVGPLLIILLLRYAFPPLAERWPAASAYEALIVGVALLLVPLLPGTMAGFLMLDERDEKLIPALSVTPLSKAGYFRYRIALPAVLSTFYAVLLLPLSRLVPVEDLWGALPAVAVMAALQAPLFALAMAAFAANKLEGLAISKLSGWVVFAPALLLLPEPYQWGAAALPTYWSAKAYEAAVSGSVGSSLFWGIGGAAYHVALFVALFKKFIRKIE
ncbi:hypothetical protein MO973_12355 [Paenibacillus sp. TRM 82003]|nr:hypothetical protein [Paenibacillus sp. TRM 82003]